MKLSVVLLSLILLFLAHNTNNVSGVHDGGDDLHVVPDTAASVSYHEPFTSLLYGYYRHHPPSYNTGPVYGYYHHATTISSRAREYETIE